MRVLLAAVALFALSACDPEQEAAVIRDYADRMSSRAVVESVAGPTWSVDADCNGAHVVLDGWTGVTDISPSTGQAYAIIGMGNVATTVPLDGAGSTDVIVPAVQGVAGTTAWSWTLIINGNPYLLESGLADC